MVVNLITNIFSLTKILCVFLCCCPKNCHILSYITPQIFMYKK